MKKLMGVLFILNLVIANCLSASAAQAAGAGQAKAAAAAGKVAHQAAKQGNEPLELPANVIVLFDPSKHDGDNHLKYEQLKEWLDKNPEYLNAIDKKTGSTVTMLAIAGLGSGGRNLSRLDYILSKQPNVLIRDNNGENAISLLLKSTVYSDFKKILAIDIANLIIKQSIDLQGYITWAKENLAKAQTQLIKEVTDNNQKNLKAEFENGNIETLSNFIRLLELEQNKRELKEAREYLTTSAQGAPSILPRALGALFAPSEPRLLAIKHAIKNGDIGILARELGEDEDETLLEMRDAAGYTPFLYAAYVGNKGLMRYLIGLGADTNAKTKDGAGATDFGDYQKLIDEELNARRLRLEKEEYDRKAERERIKRMAQINTVALFKEMQDNPQQIWLHKFPIEYKMPNDKGLTLLMVAASLGINQVVEHILKGSRDKEFEAEPDLALQDLNGNTALHWAIVSGHFNIANLLVEKMDQKSIAAKNKNGFTAYDLAIKYEDKYKDSADFQKLIDVLKKNGAQK